MKLSHLSKMDILGVPIVDFVHCSRLIAENCMLAKALLKALVDVSAVVCHSYTCAEFSVR